MSIKSVPPEKAAFIRFELENGDNRRKKVALQEIARICRTGGRFAPDTRNGLELTINGLLSAQQDDKVTRWGLNSIAQIGTRDGSLSSVEHTLRKHEGNPEIVAAGVAALSKLHGGQLEDCAILGSVQPEIKILAALQVTPASRLDLRGFQINVDTADDEVLKLALITVGLNRAFENLFHPRHSNADLVRALGNHDNIIVKQYSVWSVIENVGLSINDLGIPLDTLEDEPPNVQSKLLQLCAAQTKDPSERQDIIRRGSYLPSVIAREGLAKGIQYAYYEGMQDITINWFDFEGDNRVKEILAEHFARFGSKCSPYEQKALDIMEEYTILKTRLYVGAEGSLLFAKLKANDLREGTKDLFAGDVDPLIAELARRLPVKKILMMCVSPRDADKLRLDEEARDLKEQLRLVDKPKQDIKVEHAWAVRTDQVQMEVLNSTPNIIHFSGHGDTGALCFEDKDGNTALVSADALEGLIKLSDNVECVVLNACYSESISNNIKPYVRAVIGCVNSISDSAAIGFSKAFYRSLAHGHNFRRAFDLERVHFMMGHSRML